MAAAPVKSPLHNFPLTFLKWGSKKDQQRCRRSPFDSPLSPPPPSSSDVEPPNSKGSRSSRNRRNNHHHHPPTPPPPSAPAQDDEEERDCGKKPEVAEEGVNVNEGEGDGEKGWNLRPRRAAAMKGVAATNSTTTNTNCTSAGGGTGTTVGETAGDNLPKSMRLRGLETQGNGGANGGGASERRGIKRFWISLSNKEIEEDIYSMTGSKPSRRPKKRPKNVQKQLDNVFPGLWMVGFSPEYYRCLDVPPKR